MNVLILNGGPGGGRGTSSRAAAAAVASAARAKGHDVTVLDLDAMTIKPCRGCFACWVKHPGTCAIRDGQEPVLRAMAAADLQLWITPVTFGGYSSALKKALDRFIPNALPFFVTRQGEVHHPRRYEKRRNLVVIGTLPGADPAAEAVFHKLARRNGLNLDSALTESLVVRDGEEDALAGQMDRLLAAAGEAI
jgi:multimeric flavodoxin WrbA